MSLVENPLSEVKAVIAVASGKGGVGKSTSTVFLARALAEKGAKVGILDADVYGPSIPIMTKAPLPTQMDGNFVLPEACGFGIKVISAGMFASSDKAQILRGPMAGNFIKQILNQVKWGPLDYLLIDYPPGTSDIQLTISQQVHLAGAVMVTTSQYVSVADVIKALHMFEVMKTPILGVIETMAHFVCQTCDTKHPVFFAEGGKNHARLMAQSKGLPFLAQIPMDPFLTQLCDEGKALETSISLQKSSGYEAYVKAAEGLMRETMRMKTLSSHEGLDSFQLTWR